MSDSVAEAYLLILRPSMIPVIGEAVPFPFEQQIEIDEWGWSLENEEYAQKRKLREKEQGEVQSLADAADSDSDDTSTAAFKSLKSLPTQVNEIQRRKNLSETQRATLIRELISDAAEDGQLAEKKSAASVRKKKKKEDDKDDDRLKFTFKKNVDASTTQLLNSLKSGDVMPRAIITLFHRSTNAPVTLAIKFEKVRLKSFTLSVDPSDMMSDLKEEWTANYESMEYSYQNRPAASGPNGLTKGTVRVFKKKGGSFI